MDDRTIRDRADMCAAGCQTDLCSGGQRSCGSCCGCRERCLVTRVAEQMDHPLVRLAADERIYATDIHRFDRQHDDQHSRGELTSAASAYALAAAGRRESAAAAWPWDPGAFTPGDPERDLARAMQFLMAEWDRQARQRLMIEAFEHPVLPPRALCDGDQEIWHAGSGWWIQVFEREDPSDGWRARVYVDGPAPIVGAGNGVSQRAAAFEALQDAEVPDAERLASHWPDLPGGQDQVQVVVTWLREGDSPVCLATAVVDGLSVGKGRAATEEQARAQALLNAGIGFSDGGQPAGRVPEWVKNLPAPAPQQAMSRGWHPDQAVVETDPVDESRD